MQPSFEVKEIVQRLVRTRGFRQWLGKGFWAIADQGLFASSNFVLNILLARWLTPQEYGAFAVVFAGFLLLSLLHSAVLAEPMLVFGPDRYKARLPEYLGALLYGHLGFSAPSSLLVLLIGLGTWFFGLQMFFWALLSLAVTAPFILFQHLMRRACYVRFNPRLSAFGGVLYLILMLLGVYVLYQRVWLSVPAAFALMGISSLASGLLLTICLRVRLPPLRSTGITQESFKDHWGYGRWSVSNRAVSWITESSYFLFLPVFSGLEASAAVRALLNLMMPVVQTYWSLSPLFLPALIQARGRVRFRHIVSLILALYIFSALAYWLVLGLFHRPLTTWIYGGQYTEYANLLWFLALYPLLLGAAEVLSTALRALGRVDQVFWSAVFAAVAALTVGLGSIYALGVTGAVVWLLVTWATITGTLAWFLWSSRQTWWKP